MSEQPIHVLVAADFKERIIESLAMVSPRVHIEHHFPNIPDKAWEQAEVLLTFNIFPEPKQAPNLKWIQLGSAGMERPIKHSIVADTDVILTSASGMHAVQMAEHTFGMMLAWEYHIPRMVKDQMKAHWGKRDLYEPSHLREKTIGIVGYGSIGREIARLANQFGMNVLATKRDVMNPAETGSYTEPGTGDPEGEIPDRLYPPEALASMARECDFLVVLVPLTEATTGMVSAEVLDAMRETAVLVNIARGKVIDEEAMIKALKRKKIAGALLDVFSVEPLPASSPLWGLENVLISPHVSGNSSRYLERVAALFAENLQRYIERGELLNKYDREHGY